MDPYEHLMWSENSTILHRYGEGVKCRVFLTTLCPRRTYNFSRGKDQCSHHGLRDGDLFSSLAKKYTVTFDDLLRRAEKYITIEEVQKAK
ncbi:hypothetical protein ACS0TY_034017 [Phlomoides rotata]